MMLHRTSITTTKSSAELWPPMLTHEDYISEVQRRFCSPLNTGAKTENSSPIFITDILHLSIPVTSHQRKFHALYLSCAT